MKRTFDRSKIRAAVFDIDGTIFSYGVVPKGTAKTLKDLSDTGVQIFISTGRSPDGVPDEIKVIKEFRYGIFCDGAIVKDTLSGEVIKNRKMSIEQSRQVAEFLMNFSEDLHIDLGGCGIITDSDFKRFSLNYAEGTERETAMKELLKNYTVAHDARELCEDITEPVIKLGCRFKTRDELLAKIDTVRAGVDCEVVETDANLIELTSRGVDKGSGLLILCSYLGMRPEETVVFGDSGNDVSMFKYAGFAVVMGNAYDDVKKEGDMVTGDVKDGGAMMAVKELFGI